MSTRSRLVALLLRAYPREWRTEYGPELAEVLEERALGVSVVADVLSGALRQRATSAEPSTICGVAAMVVIAVGLGLNIAGVPAIGRRLPSLLQDSWKLFPSVVVTPLETELYVLWLVACGCWTVLRRGPSARAGAAGVKMTALAGTPIVLMGALMLLGLLEISTSASGPASTSLGDHGFTFTYYSRLHQPPSPLAIVLAPFPKLAESWLWGALGGGIGRSILRSRATRSA